MNAVKKAEIAALRQEHRDTFTGKLRAAYPDPESVERQQCEPMMDRWWPGTQPTSEESSGKD